jgi:prophage regulatory protein
MTPLDPALLVAVDRIVHEKERRHITGVGLTKWREMERAGTVPPRREASGRTTGWLLSELVAWVKARPLAPRAQPAHLALAAERR